MQFSSLRHIGNNLTATNFAVTLAEEPKMTFKSQGRIRRERRLQLRYLIKVVIGCALAAGSSALTTARAQTDDIATYPNRPIRVIIAVAAGGTMDVVARVVGQKLTEAFGQPIVIENKPGAQTIIGTEFAARAPADGYTLIVAPVSSIAINPAIYPKLRYSADDFAPISIVGSYPFILTVNNDVPAHTLRELVDYMKKNPDQANAGGGTASHQLMTELFKSKTGSPIQYIPYKGMNEVVTALVGGQLQMAFLTASNAAQIRDGLLRPLGITASQRVASFPNVPTMEEAGVDGMSAVSWAGFLAPARTPPMIIKKLESEIIRIVKLPDVQKRLRAAELDPVGNSADEFARTIKADVTTWTAVAKAAKIQIDQ
jgi:tripartite-type tricarboxylate transporter receptor subunit TctC